MPARLRRLVASAAFHRAVIGLILLNAALMGLEAWPAAAARWGAALAAVGAAVQVLFVVELALRLGAHGARPLAFFRDGWNLFDFAVVSLSLLPAVGPFATVARLARVLRVARLVSGLPELRLIVGTMLRSIPSMGHVLMLLGLLVYVYGVLGFHLFGHVDPERWGSLARAAATLFAVMTLEGWVEIMEASAAGTAWAWLFYASFIVMAVFVVINLFVAVVLDNLEKVRHEEDGRAPPASPPDPASGVAVELTRLAARIDALSAEVRSLRERSPPGPRTDGPRAA